MKKAELILGLICLIAILLYKVGIEEAGPILIMGISALSLLYMYLSFALFNGIPLRKLFSRAAYQGIPINHIIRAIPVGVVLSICLIGILFGVMGWPGAKFQLKLGMIALMIIAVVGVILHFRKPIKNSSRIFMRLIIVGAFAFGLWLAQPAIHLRALGINEGLAEMELYNDTEIDIVSVEVELVFLDAADEILLVDTVSYRMTDNESETLLESGRQTRLYQKVPEKCDDYLANLIQHQFDTSK